MCTTTDPGAILLSIRWPTGSGTQEGAPAMILKPLIVAFALLGPALCPAVFPALAQAQDAPPRQTVTPAFRGAIPNIPGKSLVAVIVDYAPGAKSTSHRHAPSAFIYAHVIARAVRSQVDDQPAKVYRAGEG